jgi:hypothetical protein
MRTHHKLRFALLLLVPLGLFACNEGRLPEAPPETPGGESPSRPSEACDPEGKASCALISSDRTDGDWTDLPDGEQCVPGAREFFQKHFNASFPLMPNHWTENCPPLGACHLWLDAQPDPNVWERIDASGGTPQTYDLIVFPPHGTGLGKYGHAAIVDHIEGDQIFVMDDDYVKYDQRSTKPHKVDWPPYGWYRLKTLE